MNTIEGIDISHHNYNYLINQPQAVDTAKFIICKATEGNNYKDPCLPKYVDRWRDTKLFGTYHFARFDRGNRPIDEAANYIMYILENGLANNAIMVVDVEAGNLFIENIDELTRIFLDEVYKNTGIRPLLYVQQSAIRCFNKVQQGNYGLWVARYRSKELGFGIIKPWRFAAMWQYTSKPIDRDIFYGTEEQFLKYGKVR